MNAEGAAWRLRNDKNRYGLVSVTFHWAFVIAFLGQFIIYQLMHNLPVSETKWWFYDLHKSMGITLFAAVLCRLAWRLFCGTPDMPASLPKWQRRVAGASHAFLYLARFVMPISGYIGSKAGGYKASWFALYELPDLFGKNENLNFWAETVHTWTFYSLAAVIFIHASAALFHHFYWRDEVLRRMLPKWGRS